ncbi:hypothetical protein ABZ942_19425 [Nocardia sp. NPDC046473]|uniref:hypothetical protein n=1 Tax=Nocardia sp. NPDC046473 TaxID=3155733 RepID=UPI0033C18583
MDVVPHRPLSDDEGGQEILSRNNPKGQMSMTTLEVISTVSAQETGAESGLVLRDATGSLYFIRESLLTSLRVKGQGLERLNELLDGRTAGPATADLGSHAIAGISVFTYIRKEEIDQIAPQTAEEMGTFQHKAQFPPTTIMCPWFC